LSPAQKMSLNALCRNLIGFIAIFKMHIEYANVFALFTTL